MAKNSEWGAVAYLLQSKYGKYGKYGNANYTGANKQVMINNCSNMITGVGADSQDASSSTSTTSNRYTTAKGQAASTTGNITGVYDMNGGAWEYTMGVYNKTVGNSGINFSNIDAKYYDNYTSTTATSACSSGVCYGHALSETSGWYSDLESFVNSSNPWFLRGGGFNSTSNAGVFSFNSSTGNGNSNRSFRVVLVGA